MDGPFELEKILYDIDFSQGREQAVWETIVSRLPYGDDELSLWRLDEVASGLSNYTQHRERKTKA